VCKPKGDNQVIQTKGRNCSELQCGEGHKGGKGVRRTNMGMGCGAGCVCGTKGKGPEPSLGCVGTGCVVNCPGNKVLTGQ